MSSLEDIHRLLQGRGASHLSDLVDRVARPAVKLEPTPASDDVLALGASKFGGAADLPTGAVWPRTDEDQFLPFIGQVNLAEASGHLDGDPIWPRSGLLLFFYNFDSWALGYPDEECEHAVIYAPPGADLGRDTNPPDPDPDDAEMGVRRAVATPVWRLQMHRIVRLPDGYREPGMENESLDDADIDALLDVLRQVGSPLSAPGESFFGGYPVKLQDSPEVQWSRGWLDVDREVSEKEEIEEADALAADWRLLLQVELSEHFGDRVGEGTVYFGARTDSIEAGTFDETWFTMQMT